MVVGAHDLVVGALDLVQRRKDTERMWWIMELGIQNAHLMYVGGLGYG